MKLVRGTCAALLLQLSSCAPERAVDATAIVVSVDSDLDPSRLRAVEVDVLDPTSGTAVAARSYQLGAVALPFSFTIDRGQRDDVRLVVTGLDAAGTPVAEHKVDARFVAHEQRLLRVFLAASCLGELCDARTTCAVSEGRTSCVAIEQAELTSFVPSRENDWPAREVLDAGQDASLSEDSQRADAFELDASAPQDAAHEDASAPADASVVDAGPRNLLENGSFETVSGAGPASWRRDSWLPLYESCPTAPNDEEARSCWMRRVDDSASEGSHSAFISIPEATPNDARWTQVVRSLVPGRMYEACGKVRGSVGPNGRGANLYYDQGGDDPHVWWKQTGDFMWWPGLPACGTFIATGTTVEIGCRLGFYSETTYGSIWCDELSLREVP